MIRKEIENMIRKEIERQLNEISIKIKNSKIANRFNYSVGLINGDCFGASWEDEKQK